MLPGAAMMLPPQQRPHDCGKPANNAWKYIVKYPGKSWEPGDSVLRQILLYIPNDSGKVKMNAVLYENTGRCLRSRTARHFYPQ